MNMKKSNQLILTLIIIGSIFSIFFLILTKKPNKPSIKPPQRIKKNDIRRTPVVTAIEKILPSVVNLSTTKIVDRHYSPWVQPSTANIEKTEPRKSEPGYSIGSGSILDPAGLIVTSAHVVSRASKIRVTLHNGRIFEAKTISEDMENDVALLRIMNTKERFQPITGIAPDDLMLGETTIAVGNPYGLDGTITVGVLSGIGRSLTNNGKVVFTDLLQTDAPVFPGSSGGPLINLKAQMLGMNIAVRRDSPGISFAIPLFRIENILARWMIPDRIDSVQFGLVPGIRKDGTVYIRQIFPGSPAEQAGLQAGETILSFNKWNVRGDLLELLRRLWRIKAGETVEISTEKTGTVRITAKPAPTVDNALTVRFKLGISLENLTPPLAKALNYPFDSGVIVTDLTPVLSGLGVSRGDLLIKLGNRMIYSLDDVAQVLRDPDYQRTLPAYFLSLAESEGGKNVLREHRVFFHRK